MKVIPLYASLLALFYVYLSIRAIGVRRKAQISIGDGGNDSTLRAMRMHACGLRSVQAPGNFRVGGMLGTFATIPGSACWLLNDYFVSLP